MKFFNLDLHISVIADIKYIFEKLGHTVVDWSISGHTWVFNRKRDDVKVVNQDTWQNLDRKMCDAFYENYKDYLNQFDGFIVTYNASFALLYERFNKPIIVVNPTRYENPFTEKKDKLAWLNEYLIDGVRRGQVFIVSNNKADEWYLEYFTGIHSSVIPSLCLYTESGYSGKKREFILVSRLKNVVIPRKAVFALKLFSKLGATNRVRNKVLELTTREDSLTDSIQLSDLLFYKEKRLRSGYKWQALYDYQGIVHIPYNISTMSIFEEYSANVPLFFPSKKFILELQQQFSDKVLCELSFYQVKKMNFDGNDNLNPNNVANEDVLKNWINLADYYDEYNMPYIQYFDSFDDLERLLLEVNCAEVSQCMLEYNKQRRREVFDKWKGILKSIQTKET